MSVEPIVRWGWGRPEGKVYEVVVRPTCDGRGWYEPLCPDGCCGARYTKAELYESREEATKAARTWVQARLRLYSDALAALAKQEPPRPARAAAGQEE